MNNSQGIAVYDNTGYCNDEERPPPYSPHASLYPYLPPNTPHYVASTPQTINTHHTGIPGIPKDARKTKGLKRCPCRCILCSSLLVVLFLALGVILLWYLLEYQCLLGRSCGGRGVCLRPSQWCDGVTDCPDEDDESHCFRLQGTNFFLESYSSVSQRWLPVCADNWDDTHGRAVCQQMGFSSQDYVSFSETSIASSSFNGYLRLSDGSGNRSFHLSHSQNCATRGVTLQCVGCGVTDVLPSSRIIGGTVAQNGAWPWQVSLQKNYRNACGGSIISPVWILSAAHCFKVDKTPDLWTVFAGDVSLLTSKGYLGKIIHKIIPHEKYNPTTSSNDIALLKLRTPLTFSSTIKPVCLPHSGIELFTEQNSWITGYGYLNIHGTVPLTMNQAQVTIYSRETCNAKQVLNGQVSEDMICAGTLQGGVDACQGDSGGPLVVKKGGVWWLMGVTSWGMGCALPNKPGVYTNVTYFTDWIHEKMKNN